MSTATRLRGRRSLGRVAGGDGRAWLGFAVFLAVLLGAMALGSDISHVTVDEAYDALLQEPYTGQAPPGFRFMEVKGYRDQGPHVTVYFGEDHKTPGYQGTPAFIVYYVYESPDEAQQAFDDFVAGVRFESRPGEYQVSQGPAGSVCFADASKTEYCQAVVGNVYMEGLSRLRMLPTGGTRSNVELLTKEGLAHLEKAL